MAERLFRGKRADNEEWVAGSLLGIDWCDKPSTYSIAPNTPVSVFYSVIPETIGQFTGHIDKNKRRAFEGDILSHCGGSDYGVIRYGEYSSPFSIGQDIGFYVEWVSGEDINVLRKDLGYWLKAGTAEIVGNIHDNPELIQEREVK